MPPVTLLARLSLVLLLLFPLVLGGCSYLPWEDDGEDDLAFEDDFPLEDEEFMDEGRGRGRRANRGGDRDSSVEDDFFTATALAFAVFFFDRLISASPCGFQWLHR